MVGRKRTVPATIYTSMGSLNLHGFYGALERLFELIGTATDEKLPDGASWHQLLLEQMSQEVPGVRPAVISVSVKESLDEFRGFRHVARNIYSFHIDHAKLGRLVTAVAGAITPVTKELDAFAEFLEHNGQAK